MKVTSILVDGRQCARRWWWGARGSRCIKGERGAKVTFLNCFVCVSRRTRCITRQMVSHKRGEPGAITSGLLVGQGAALKGRGISCVSMNVFHTWPG